MITNVLSVMAVLAVVFHCICVAGHLNIHSWDGHRVRFVLYAVSLALLGAGALGYVAGWPPGSFFMLLGIAGRIFFDRRSMQFDQRGPHAH